MNTELQHLTETSEELADALGSTLQLVFGRSEPIIAGPIHTGGGVMVMAVDLSLDGRGIGRQVWLTREGDSEWLLGFYDFAEDVEDEGLCVSIHCPNDYSDRFRQADGSYDGPIRTLADSPAYLAAQVAGILTRLGVTKLQGE